MLPYRLSFLMGRRDISFSRDRHELFPPWLTARITLASTNPRRGLTHGRPRMSWPARHPGVLTTSTGRSPYPFSFIRFPRHSRIGSQLPNSATSPPRHISHLSRERTRPGARRSAARRRSILFLLVSLFFFPVLVHGTSSRVGSQFGLALPHSHS